MSKHIFKCSGCQIYTLEEECFKCGKATISPKPPKFSLEDKYAVYRREVKKKELETKGFF